MAYALPTSELPTLDSESSLLPTPATTRQTTDFDSWAANKVKNDAKGLPSTVVLGVAVDCLRRGLPIPTSTSGDQSPLPLRDGSTSLGDGLPEYMTA
jgi:hypothetical protein